MWWILATQGTVLETRGGDPLPTVFCEVRYAALARLGPAPSSVSEDPARFHYDVQEVLLVGPGVTTVPGRMTVSSFYGTLRGENLLLVPGLDETRGSADIQPRFTDSVGDTTYTVLGAFWMTTVTRARGAHHTVAVDTYAYTDDLIDDLRRLAPRLTDARKRWRYCERHGYPVGERPPRGAQLVPPAPSGVIGGS